MSCRSLGNGPLQPKGGLVVKQPQHLPEAELDVMLALWQFDAPVRTARILEAVGRHRSWTLPTLKVLLGRLEEKGFVKVTRQGRFTLYQALVSETDYRRRETRTLAGRFFGNSMKNMIAALVQDAELTGQDIAELEELLHKGKGGE